MQFSLTTCMGNVKLYINWFSVRIYRRINLQIGPPYFVIISYLLLTRIIIIF